MKKLYRLTEGDRAIFRAAKEQDNPNIITNYYMRHPDSGTWWRRIRDDDLAELTIPQAIEAATRWKTGYETLFAIWKYLKKPFFFAPDPLDPENWHALSEREYTEASQRLDKTYRVLFELGDDPVFHHLHGALLIPWQLMAAKFKQPVIVEIGGYACVAQETRIYDAELNQHIPIVELANKNRAPLVLAWTGTRFVEVRATVPFLKGKADLYRVTTESGRQITTTLEHRFMTDRGWMTLRQITEGADDVRLLMSAGDPPQSSSDTDLLGFQPDAVRLSRKSQGSQHDCLVCRRLYDEPLPVAQDSALDIPPSQVDAHEHNLHCFGVDGRLISAGHSPTYQQSDLHSTNRFDPLMGRLEAQFSYPDCEESGEAVPCCPSSPEGQVVLTSACYSSPETTFLVSGCGVSGTGYCCDLTCDCSPSFNGCYTQAKMELVVSVVGLERDAGFYDLHVPGYENYLAEGFVNHNSGKTLSKTIQMLVNAVTLPGYRGFALAPYSNQAAEIHKQALQILEGTEFKKRFLLGAPTKPFPRLVFGNDLVGETTIECYSIKDDIGKLLTLTADEAIIDQAEMLDDVDGVVSKVGSRFRGQVRGRPRIGQMVLVANSADNPMLWDWFDEGQEPDNKYVKSYAPNTFENTYLTVDDLKRFENTVAKDEASRRLYLFGERPLGAGEHFPRESLEKCRARWMDEQITEALEQKKPGYIREEAQRVGVYKLETPYIPGESYLVAADAGWANPPDRNSAVIGVWKYTDFPLVPAQLVAFSWVFGNNSPIPWMQQYSEYVMNYKAIGMNGFDSTGFQSGYERMTDIGDLMPTPVILSGQKKYTYLNLAKKIMAQGNFQIPTITHLFSQCAKYVLPDERLRQDIVMMLLVTAALLEPLYYDASGAGVDVVEADPSDRFYRDESRYEVHPDGERY